MNRGSAITTTTARNEKPNSLSSFMNTPSPSPSLPSLPTFSPLFSPSPIPEHEERSYDNKKEKHNSHTDNGFHHQPTPLHPSSKKKRTPRQTPTPASGCSEEPSPIAAVVSYSKCRPSSRDSKKPSVVPISPTSTTSASRRITPPSPLSLFNSLFSRRGTGPISSTTTPQSTIASTTCDDSDPQYWRATATELSKKLIAATRKRDEALLETSKLKYSLSELELKLARLESSYHDLAQPNRTGPAGLCSVGIEPDRFVKSVSDSRAASRILARALSSHLRKNPVHGSSGLLPAHMEAFLNRVFYSGFELDVEEETRVADPADRCALNMTAYQSIRDLTWEEVLTKGTKHFSEGLSRFCDTKMSDVVGSIGWTKSWPEPLLQAFFLAAKAAWSVRLLARSVQPPIPIIRIDRGAKFDERFMEDTASDRASTDRLEPVSVKMLVAPGFHVYNAGDTVVKCKVLCLYSSRRDGYRDGSVGDGVGQCQLRDKV